MKNLKLLFLLLKSKLIGASSSKIYFINEINPIKYAFSSLKDYVSEMLRTWKILTLIIGIILLSFCSLAVTLPDWDIPISILMALMAYIFAPLSLSLLFTINYKKLKMKDYLLMIMLFIFYILTVDISYVAYNHLRGHMYFRLANFFASSLLYFLCGLIWIYKGAFKELMQDLKNIDIKTSI